MAVVPCKHTHTHTHKCWAQITCAHSKEERSANHSHPHFGESIHAYSHVQHTHTHTHTFAYADGHAVLVVAGVCEAFRDGDAFGGNRRARRDNGRRERPRAILVIRRGCTRRAVS